MPRTSRKISQSAVYHIMLRGNNKEPVFQDEKDKEKICRLIMNLKDEKDFGLFSYCILNNHIHLVIREIDEPIACIIKRIATSYAIYYNKKYSRIGHVFQDRYKSECVDNERYLLSVIRYVHQNPVKAGAGTIAGYRWSSYQEYFSNSKKYIDKFIILKMFNEDINTAREQFREFNNLYVNEQHIDENEDKFAELGSVKEFIDDYMAYIGLSYRDLRKPENRKNLRSLIKEVFTTYSVSVRYISDILGVGREIIRKLQKETSVS